MVHVAEAQIRQRAPGRVDIAIVPRPGFVAADEDALLRECGKRFGDRLAVRIETVDSIERTPRGKLKLVVRDPSHGPQRNSTSSIG